MWRIWAALGMLEPDGQGGIKRSPEYRELDATEKTHMNYVLGGTMTKAYAASKLGVPWLAHLSVAERAGYTIEFSGNRRPDYLGYANNLQDLVIAEAKGRQGPDSKLRSDLAAKAQVSGIKKVNGEVPAKRYGVLAEARLDKAVSLYAVEPPENVNINFDAIRWVKTYYEFARDLVESCAKDPRPGSKKYWARVDLEVPKVISNWLDSECGHERKHRPEQEWETWLDIQEKAQSEAKQKSSEDMLRSDLLIINAKSAV